MDKLIKEAPQVADAFFAMTKSIRESSALETKVNELVLIGVFTASRSLRGLKTHTERALQAGATRGEIISAVYLALPVCGIASVNMALNEVIACIGQELEECVSG